MSKVVVSSDERVARAVRISATSLVVGAVGLCLVAVASTGCGGDASAEAAFGGEPQAELNLARLPDGSYDDRSMCEWRGKPDVDVSETAGPAAILPNVRRVWKVVGEGARAQRHLICREADTNFDGIKDVVKKYNEDGDPISENSDSNYDGQLDTWITFAGGKLAEVKLDNNKDGNPDEWKSYNDGELQRIKRDRDFNGKADTWEIYKDGTLERMGVDVDGDERVDRWDYDKEARAEDDDEDDGSSDDGSSDDGSSDDGSSDDGSSDDGSSDDGSSDDGSSDDGSSDDGSSDESSSDDDG